MSDLEKRVSDLEERVGELQGSLDNKESWSRFRAVVRTTRDQARGEVLIRARRGEFEKPWGIQFGDLGTQRWQRDDGIYFLDRETIVYKFHAGHHGQVATFDFRFSRERRDIKVEETGDTTTDLEAV